MSETNPNDPQADSHDPDALTRGNPKGEPRKSDAQRKADQERAADLARLAELQSEYVKVRDELKNAPTPAANPGAAALARKGEIAREISEIKRKHDLSL